MGFFAKELEHVLRNHIPNPHSSPWSLLAHMQLHPQQIDRLKKAAEDFFQVASLNVADLTKLRVEYELSPIEFARLEAAIEGDVFLRMFLYHGYPPDEAANYANALFAAGLRDRTAILATPAIHDDIVADSTAFAAGQPRRGRGIRRRVERETPVKP